MRRAQSSVNYPDSAAGLTAWGTYRNQDGILHGSKKKTEKKEKEEGIRLSSQKAKAGACCRKILIDQAGSPFSPILQKKLSDPSKSNFLLYISGE